MIIENKEKIINNYMWNAFLLGAWYGQAEMEQAMDNNSFFDACLTFAHSQKTGGKCLHTVSSDNINSRPVRYNLRSDKWRKAIFGKKEEFKNLIPKMIKELK